MAYGVVYALIDATSDREYVGITTRAVEVRFKEHTKSKYYIGRAIREIGAENFLIVILKECDSKEELDYWEKHFIKSRDTLAPNGYNLTEGGEGTVGFHRGKLTPEHRAKLAAAHIGKKHTAEECVKIGAARKGKKHPPRTPEWCAKQSAAHCGKKHTPEHCAKKAVAHRKPSPYRILQNEIEKRGLTYTGIDKAIGLTQNFFSMKMRGKSNFMPAQKLAIKNFLGVEMSVEELFKREN